MKKSKSKVVILGGTGMLGHMLYSYLSSLFDVTLILRQSPTYSSKFILNDFNDLTSLLNLINDFKPIAIVNTLGILISESDTNPKTAFKINSFLPKLLSDYFHDTGVRLIQISTDCIYSGLNGPYRLDSIPDSYEIYGMTKFIGEINNNKDLTIRTSIIGPNLDNKNQGLFDWFFENDKMLGYKNVFWNGVTTLELSKFISNHINSKLSGIILVTNGDVISKYELLVMINNVFFNNFKVIIPDFEIKLNKGFELNQSETMITSSYLEMLIELKQWMIQNSGTYSKYLEKLLDRRLETL